MVLAERPDPTGAFDFEALAVPAIGRVLRYALIGTTADGRRIWQQEPDDYAIGFPADFNNGNGGVAIGYNYDRQGDISPGSCGGFMWATGEDLRHAADAALSATLAARAHSMSPACKATAPGWYGPPMRRRWRAISSIMSTSTTTRRRAATWATSPSSACARRRCLPLRFRSAACRRPADRRQARRPAGHAAESAWLSAVEDLRIARHAGLPARADHSRGHEQLRAKLPASRRPDQRQVLLRHLDRGQRRLLEFELPVGANGDRPEQFLLQQRPGLYRRERRPGVLQRETRERQVLDADAQSADIELRQGLCADRQRLLPGQQGDLDRRLLPGRRSAKRPEQEPMRKDRPRSDRAAMLHVGNSDGERQMLRARECDDQRRLLSGTGRSEKPQRLHDADSACRLRDGLYENAGRLVLQQPLHRRRRKILQHQPGSLSGRPIPRCQRRLRADPVGALSERRGAKPRRHLRGGAGGRRLCAGRNSRSRRQLCAGPARPRSAAAHRRAAKAGSDSATRSDFPRSRRRRGGGLFRR